MRERDGGRIVGIPQDNIAWEGNRGEMEMGSLVHGRQPADTSAGFTDQGRAAELPCRGLPRTGRDEDGNADAFLQPSCLGYREDLGCGRFPSSKMITISQT